MTNVFFLIQSSTHILDFSPVWTTTGMKQLWDCISSWASDITEAGRDQRFFSFLHYPAMRARLPPWGMPDDPQYQPPPCWTSQVIHWHVQKRITSEVGRLNLPNKIWKAKQWMTFLPSDWQDEAELETVMATLMSVKGPTSVACSTLTVQTWEPSIDINGSHIQ